MDDKFQLMKYAERLADDIPTSSLVPIKNARHFVMLDCPAEVAEEVLSLQAGRSA